jgi:hypothetical protein
LLTYFFLEKQGFITFASNSQIQILLNLAKFS